MTVFVQERIVEVGDCGGRRSSFRFRSRWLYSCESQWERATSVSGRQSIGVSRSGDGKPGVRPTVCMAADFTKDDTTLK